MYEFSRVDTHDDWINTAYCEDGDVAVCGDCGEELRWDPDIQGVVCPSCGKQYAREEYFDHIGANPPSDICLTDCRTNYPFCKKTCGRVEIDPGDPMLD